MAEQLELLFEAPPAVPGRPAADPAESPKTGQAGRTGRFRQTPEKKPAHNDAVTRPQQQSDTGESAGPAGATLGVEPATIPARCPVVGKPVCYRDGCRHFQGGGCVHPEVVRPRRRRRP